MHNVSIDGLIPFIQKPLGLHIRTKPYSIPLTLQHSLYKTSLDIPVSESTLSLYSLVAIILDFLNQFGVKDQDEGKRSFLPLLFVNKGIDAINFPSQKRHERNSTLFQRQINTDYFIFLCVTFCIQNFQL